MRARNVLGYGDFSDTVSILAAQIPDAPTGVTTTFTEDNVVINWSEPYNRGSEILGYKVYI